MADLSREKAIKGVEAVFERYKLLSSTTTPKFTGFDTHIMSALKIIDASMAGTVTYTLLIDHMFGNLNGVMHGGAAGVIFDMATTTALAPIAKPGFWDFLGGVTRTLNISYLHGVPIGTTVHLHSVVQSAGRTMAMIRGEMTSLDGKTIYCTAEHHKVSVPTRPEHLLAKVEWDRGFEVESEGGKLKDGAKL